MWLPTYIITTFDVRFGYVVGKGVYIGVVVKVRAMQLCSFERVLDWLCLYCLIVTDMTRGLVL